MTYTIVGLGNPGDEYKDTRHNTGRFALEAFRKEYGFPEWQYDKKLKALISKGFLLKVNGQKPVVLILPETFMNKSGVSVGVVVKNLKQAERLIVAHDDLDLPLGRLKVSFAKSSGGHRGVESIIKILKTDKFIRLRVGISPKTSKGVVKKPKGEKAVSDFILGSWKLPEKTLLKKISRVVTKALHAIVLEGKESAMSRFNS